MQKYNFTSYIVWMYNGSLALKDQRKLNAFEHKVLRRITGPRKCKITQKWGRLHNEAFHCLYLLSENRDISVGIALGYGLDDRSSRVRFPAGAGNFSLHHRVQNGSGAHRAPFPLFYSSSSVIRGIKLRRSRWA
jgi:hypothetical protein